MTVVNMTCKVNEVNTKVSPLSFSEVYKEVGVYEFADRYTRGSRLYLIIDFGFPLDTLRYYIVYDDGSMCTLSLTQMMASFQHYHFLKTNLKVKIVLEE